MNKGPDSGRTFPNSSMIGIGITMEGINQNELIYEFMLEKAWRSVQSLKEISEWFLNLFNFFINIFYFEKWEFFLKLI